MLHNVSTVDHENIARPRVDVKPTVDHNGGMTREDPPLRIRLPEALKAKVKALAAENHRSMNAEIVSRLEWSIAQGDMVLVREPPSAPPTPSLEEEVASLKTQLRNLRKQVGEIDTRTQHLLPAKKK